MMQVFKINDAYTVRPDVNTIDSATKLEPRLMKLLCLLVARSGDLVTREEIVEKIWDGYGGGDEGLTQAISYLRKALNDADKTIIETVPKSGYIFRGNIKILDATVSPSASSPEKARYISYRVAAAMAALMILIFGVILYMILSQQPIAPTAPPSKTTTEGFAPKAPK